jgi:bifunctional DNA-binding transcriptional regulator/antitoxin component of YhaV-PrlF toxin-antitoxin module
MSQSAQMTKIVRPLRGGQVTIPVAFRKELGIGDDTMLRMTLVEGELRIKPVEVSEPTRGSSGLRALYDYFAPVREEILARGISQEELYADIDAAIAEVRAEQRTKKT